jgi:hypothetical protein
VPVDKPTPEELAYWNGVLKYHGLGMDRGATLGGRRPSQLNEEWLQPEGKKVGVNG